jgi:hypothetical protein
MINLIGMGYYALVVIIFTWVHYKIFQIAHNYGFLDSFYTDILRLSPKARTKFDEFFNKKISARPVIQQIQQIVRAKPKPQAKITAKPAPQRATTELNDIPSI